MYCYTLVPRGVPWFPPPPPPSARGCCYPPPPDPHWSGSRGTLKHAYATRPSLQPPPLSPQSSKLHLLRPAALVRNVSPSLSLLQLFPHHIFVVPYTVAARLVAPDQQAQLRCSFVPPPRTP